MNFKFIASGIGFTAFGAILGWAVTADAADRKFKKLYSDNASLQEALVRSARRSANLELDLEERTESLEILRTSLEDRMNSSSENSAGETPVEINSGGTIVDVDAPNDEVRSKLQGYIDQYAGPNYQEEFQERTVVASTKYDPPFVISQNLYAWDEDEGDEYAKITLTWYPKQQVLLDEDQEPVEDVEAYVGFQNLKRFGDESDNPDVVFIRNRRLDTDFEVVREEEDELPLHVRYAMPKIEFDAQRASGRIRLRETDE